MWRAYAQGANQFVKVIERVKCIEKVQEEMAPMGCKLDLDKRYEGLYLGYIR